MVIVLTDARSMRIVSCRCSKRGDDIVDGEWCISKVGSGNSPSSKESQLLQMSVDLLCVYECEDKDGGESRGNSNGYA